MRPTEPTERKKKAGPEIKGAVIIAVSSIFLLFLCLPFILGEPGRVIRNALLGVFGLTAYPYALCALAAGVLILRKQKVTLKRYKIFSGVGMYFCAMLILHLVTSAAFLAPEAATFSSYMADCFNSSQTAGGVILGLPVFAVQSVAGNIFSYVLFTFLLAVCALGWTNFSVLKPKKPERKPVVTVPQEKKGTLELFQKTGATPARVNSVGQASLFVDTIKPQAVQETRASEVQSSKRAESKKTLFGFAEDFAAQPAKTAPADNTPHGDYSVDLGRAGRRSGGAAVGAAGAAEMPRPLVHAEQPDVSQEQNEYGFNPIQAVRKYYSGMPEQSSAPVRQSKVSGINIMPDKIPVQPDVVRQQGVRPAKIIYNADSAARARAPQADDSDVKRAKIIDGDEFSGLLKKQGAPNKEEAAAPVTEEPGRPAVKSIFERLIVGDVESERLKSEKGAPKSEPYTMDNFAPLKPKEPQVKAPPKNPTVELYKKLLEEKRSSSIKSEASATAPQERPPAPKEPSKKITDGSMFTEINFDKLKDKSGAAGLEKKESGFIIDNISDGDLFEFKNPPDGLTAGEPKELTFDDRVDALINSDKSEAFPEGKRFVIGDADEYGADAKNEAKYVPPTDANRKKSLKDGNIKDQLGFDDYKSSEEASSEYAPSKKPKRHFKYIPPIVELLDNSSTFTGVVDEECQEKAKRLEETLKEFGTTATVSGIAKGPAVTRYELQMGTGTPVRRVQDRADDIAYTLAAKGAIRVEAPIPGKQAVGVEVPNDVIDIVSLREIIDSKEFQKASDPLSFALGKDIAGEVKVCALSKMPHLLIAGATNSGKSSCLNSLITSLIYKYSPDDLKFLLIDPKRVEFINYQGLPHMLLEKAITESDAAIQSLNWIHQESERRYKIFEQLRASNIKDYASKTAGSAEYEKLPYIVIIIDEVADLMLDKQYCKQIEDQVKYLSAKARAAGIHLVLATQRPSVDVITGTIKANLPSRIAFSVTSFIDAKTILDSGGAEKLLGRGDMLYMSNNAEPVRIQGAYVSGQEVEAVVNYVKQYNECEFDDDIKSSIYAVKETAAARDSDDDSEDGERIDPLMLKVLRHFIESEKASISLVQRKFSVGFNRAACIVDALELSGYIGPSDGISKQRKINMSIDEFVEKFGDIEI